MTTAAYTPGRMAHAPCTACGSTDGPEHVCPGLAARLVGKVLDGRYQIERLLGQGGMGMVFGGKQTSMGRPVAVKTLHPSLVGSPAFFARFKREAEIASRLNHPHIVTVFDFGRTEDGICYIVMELLHGESLKQIIKRDGPLSIRRAANLIEQAARGLGYAHTQGVVHRDLKPHNIMVQRLDGIEFSKVLDFGLVKAVEPVEGDESLTSTGQVLGTPQYMSPEQASGEAVDQRSDLYSLGGVLYYCLTGVSPFGANTVRKALHAALTSSVPPISSRRSGPAVPEALEAFVQRALSSEKEDRHQSADEFVAELRLALFDLSDARLDAPAVSMLDDDPSSMDSRALRSQPSQRPHSNPIPSRISGARGSIQSGKTTPPRARAHSASARQSHSPASQRAVSAARMKNVEPETVAAAPAIDHSGITQRTRSLWRQLLLALPVVALAVGGTVFLRIREGAQQPTAEVTAKPITKPTLVEPEKVSIRIQSSPSGAAVLENGIFLGTTPLDQQWDKGQTRALTLQLQGYAVAKQQIIAMQNDIVDVPLEPDAAPVIVPAPTPPPSRPASSSRPNRGSSSAKKKPREIPVFE